jgi:uncharacterized protein YkwD
MALRGGSLGCRPAVRQSGVNDLEMWMMRYTNQLRSENGKGALCGNNKLMTAARDASEKQVCPHAELVLSFVHP